MGSRGTSTNPGSKAWPTLHEQFRIARLKFHARHKGRHRHRIAAAHATLDTNSRRQLFAKPLSWRALNPPRTVRLATASLIGTTLEYYDFAVYSTLAALIFNRLFFPSFDPLSGTILALSTFAVGYLARPIGGMICGNLGEHFGRRFVLVTTLVVMGTTTAMIGLLPTY